jgi:hypothetical protein
MRLHFGTRTRLRQNKKIMVADLEEIVARNDCADEGRPTDEARIGAE